MATVPIWVWPWRMARVAHHNEALLKAIMMLLVQNMDGAGT